MDPLEEKAKGLIAENNKSVLESAEQKAQKLVDEAKSLIESKSKEQTEAVQALEKSMNDAVAELKAAQKAGNKAEVKSLTAVIEEHKEAIEKSVRVKGAEYDFEVKADTLRASVVGNPAAHEVSEIGQLAHRKLTLYDLFAKVPVGSGSNGVIRYTDWDSATTVRAAAMVAEGAAFPESTAKWATYTLDLKKIGDSIPVSEELFYDAPRFAAELNQFLQTNVNIVRDTQLYSGDNTGQNIKGIVTSVDAYTAAASGIADASIYDLVVKVKADITATGGSKYNPDFVLMNSSDIAKLILKKDANNNYVRPPFADAAGMVIDGVRVVECNAVTANTFILGDSRYAKIYEVPGVVVSTGLNGTDFSEDMVTMKAKTRLAFLIRNADKGGFKKVTSISAALTTLATAA